MKKELESRIEEWKEIRSLTYDFIESLTDEQLCLTVGNNMGSLGKQFRHMGDVHFCYNEGIRTGKIDFNKYKRDYSLETSKGKLTSFLPETAQQIQELIKLNKVPEKPLFLRR